MESTLKKHEKRAKELLSQMTLEEKAGLCSGQNFWETKGVPRLGVEPVMVTDGPHGLRKQAGASDHLGINVSVSATCFPTAAATACSFDPALLREVGEALGEECLQEQVAVVLGPGANIKRSPLCGRNFEYFSEDPYLTGVMASALIEGVQSRGVGTSMKHYAANNQETRRMTADSVIDARALREIYLTGYEMAVKDTQPWTMMCCYNKVNGEFGSQNHRLLTEILRDEWGFEGAVMTDWGATVDRVKGLAAGLDLEMPYTGPANDKAIVVALKSGELALDILDTAATRMLCLLLASAEAKAPGYKYDAAAHHELARRMASASAVLLKNEENLLPLTTGKKLAVVGQFAKNPRYQGAGSSRINPIKLENLCDVLSERGVSFEYSQGYDVKADTPDDRMIADAVTAAKGAEAAVVCIGLPDAYESEGFDRDHMRLPDNHVALLKSVAEVNKNTVVLLFGGSAVEMPWIGDAKSVLMLYLGGESGALAAADLLFGDVNPSGRLAESYPRKLEDNPSYRNFPGGDKTVEYRESIYVGYRYYDKAGADVLFPFGYGLSYTDFQYSDLKITKKDLGAVVSLKVKNLGTVCGAEIVQVYVSQNNPSVFKPVRELKGFSKVCLEPNEEKEVTIALAARAFAYYDDAAKGWCVEAGEYTIEAAASSRDTRLSTALLVDGEAPKTAAKPAAYDKLSAPLNISAEDFEALYASKLPAANREPGERFTTSSSLGDIANTAIGGMLTGRVRHEMAKMLDDGESQDESMGLMLKRMVGDMPLRSLAMLSGGRMTPKTLKTIVGAINAEQSVRNGWAKIKSAFSNK